MSQVTIRARENGPFVVTGDVVVLDHLGNAFDLGDKRGDKGNIALCRCGHSARKPFCDGSHRHCGFVAGDLAAPPLPPTSQQSTSGSAS